MNVFVCILIVFALIGLVDKILHNRLQLGTCFDQGMASMPGFCTSILGFYCVLSALVENIEVSDLSNSPWLCTILGSLLAPDLGGYTLISSIQGSGPFHLFTAVLLTSTIGCTISFQFPVFLSQLKKEDVPIFMQGIVLGILALFPLCLFFLIWIPIYYLWPLFLLYGALILGILFFAHTTIRILSLFAKAIQFLGLLFFGVVIISCLFSFAWIEKAIILEGLYLVFQIAWIVAGANVLCQLILRYGQTQLNLLSRWMHIEKEALVAILLSLGSSIAIVDLYKDLNQEGKLINAGISVSAAYALGGQMGFIASMTDTKTTLIFILFKLTGGLLAILLIKKVKTKVLTKNQIKG